MADCKEDLTIPRLAGTPLYGRAPPPSRRSAENNAKARGAALDNLWLASHRLATRALAVITKVNNAPPRPASNGIPTPRARTRANKFDLRTRARDAECAATSPPSRMWEKRRDRYDNRGFVFCAATGIRSAQGIAVPVARARVPPNELVRRGIDRASPSRRDNFGS